MKLRHPTLLWLGIPVSFAAWLLSACSGPPQVTLVASGSSGAAPAEFSFTATPKNAKSLTWDFGDGKTEIVAVQKVQPPVTHKYTEAKSYTVTVTASDGGNPPVTVSATHSVSVTPGALDSIVLNTTKLDIVAGGGHTFTATAKDQFGSIIPDGGLTFQVEAGAGSVDDKGAYKAATKAGAFEKGVAVQSAVAGVTKSVIVPVTIKPGPLASVKIEDGLSMAAKGSAQVRATALDSFGNVIPGLSYAYGADSKAGTIDAQGAFSAGSVAGSYEQAITVNVTEGSNTKSASVRVVVRPGPLDQVKLESGAPNLGAAKSSQLKASAYDVYGNVIPGLSLLYALDPAIGQVDAQGNLVASQKAGSYDGALTILVTEGSITKAIRSSVVVQPGPLTKVAVSPATLTIDVGKTRAFSLQALDEYGNVIPDAEPSWQAAPELGAITPAGLLSLTNKAGTYAAGVKVNVRVRGVSIDTGIPVTVKAGLPAKLTLNTIQVAAGGTAAVATTVEDAYGNLLPDAVTLSVSDVNAGSLAGGTLTAGKVAGTYSAVVQGTLGSLSQKVNVTIVPGPLAQVVAAPGQARIGLGMTQQFVAVGADQYGNRISGLTYTWAVQSGGGSITPAGLFTAGSTSGSFSNTVKVTAASGSLSQSTTANVTVEPDRVWFPSYVVSGTTTTYKSNLMRLDGSEMTVFPGPISSTECGFSPDGWRMACTGAPALYVSDRDGGNSRVLASYPASVRFYSPRWSLDGRRIVVEYTTYTLNSSGQLTSITDDLAVVDADGGNLVRLTNTSSIEEQDPQWTADGSLIYWTPGTSTTAAAIWLMNADGSNNRRWLPASTSADWSPAVSADGRDIVFNSSRDGRSEIHRAAFDGSNVRRLTTTSQSTVFNLLPVWAPDGRILFFSNRDGNWEIYSMDRDGGSQTRLTNRPDEDIAPVVSPRVSGIPVSADAMAIPNRASLAPLTSTTITAQSRKATVRLAVTFSSGTGSGSGFLISPDGLILTANHVVRGTTGITVTLDSGATHAATVVGRDLVRDLAVIKINAKDLPFLELGDIGQLPLGSQIFAYGFPLGNTSLTVTSGLASSFASDPSRNSLRIQTDAAINPGNSGGPILDSQGKVVGLVTSGFAPAAAQNVNFAVSVNTILVYLDRLKAGQTISL